MEKLSKFIEDRSSRITVLEIAIAVYQELVTHVDKRPILFDRDLFNDGCIYQYLCFSQKILIEHIALSFIAIIGSVDKKTQQLKAWKHITFTNEQNKDEAFKKILEIRSRYDKPRNNVICHIPDNPLNETYNIPMAQIKQDAETLKEILNKIRIANNLPLLVSWPAEKQYPIMGISLIMDKLIIKE